MGSLRRPAPAACSAHSCSSPTGAPPPTAGEHDLHHSRSVTQPVRICRQIPRTHDGQTIKSLDQVNLIKALAWSSGVEVRGLEPRASSVRGRRSTRLSYTPGSTSQPTGRTPRCGGPGRPGCSGDSGHRRASRARPVRVGLRAAGTPSSRVAGRGSAGAGCQRASSGSAATIRSANSTAAPEGGSSPAS